MRIVHQNEVETMKYSGVIEGFRIIPHLVADAVNTAISACPAYEKCIIEWKRDGQIVYSGDLKTFVQGMLLRSFATTKQMQFLNAQPGVVINAAAATVAERQLADLSVAFQPQAGNHEFVIRMNDCFGSAIDAGSYILFDFDKSDEVCRELFVLRVEPVNISGDKSLNVVGNVETMLWLQSDNQFIASNDSQFNSTGVHPIQNCACTSKYSENNYTGEELQIQEITDLNGVVDFTNSVAMPLQKSVRLSDREIMVNPNVSLKLNTGSMSSSVTYNIFYDIVTFVA